MAAGLSSFFPALPISFIISIILLLLPVPGFFRGRNVAVLFYITWVLLGNAVYFINMLIWRGSVIDVAPIYCDITAFFLSMLPIGIACSLLCVNKLVWNISRSTNLSVRNDPRRNIIDSVICIVLPLLFGGLHVLVQDKRFTIVEDVGCFPSVDQSLPTLFLYFLPPSIICCCIASVYCVLAVINFCQGRYKTNSLLPDTATTAMTLNRYLRLILLCTTSVIFCAVFLLSILIKHVQIGFTTWSSWADTSWDFSHVEVQTRDDIDNSPHMKTLMLLQLLPLPILGFHFFLFFGFGGEAIRHYRRTIDAITGASIQVFRRDSNLEFDLEPSRISTITGFNVPIRKERVTSWSHYPVPRSIPPPLTVPPTAITHRSFVIMRGSPSLPSPNYSRASSRSSHSSLGVSMGHFPYPPPHFFHERPLSPRNPVPVVAPQEVNTASTRSRFSLYSDKSPVQERQERRYTKIFSVGRRPSTS